MVNKALFSSDSTEWETPETLYRELDEEFNFILDPCATPLNSKCLLYIDKEQDGLSTCWFEFINKKFEHIKKFSVFVNPPYGRKITEKWVAKGHFESLQHGLTVVMLLPSRTDQYWFREICLKYGEVRFLPKRIKFVGAKYTAPFPSIVVIFRGDNNTTT